MPAAGTAGPANDEIRTRNEDSGVVGMKRKSLSMNRTVALVMLVGYASLLILLLTICVFWISATRRDREAADRGALRSGVEEIVEAMDVLDKHVYDTYASNRNFLNLSGILSDTDNYQNVYYLQDAMQTKQALESALHGYIIYYDRLGRSWYRTRRTDILTNDQMREIVNTLTPYVNANSSLRKWLALDLDGDTVLAVSCRRDNAAIVGLYRIDGALKGIADRLGREGEVRLLPAGAGDPGWQGWPEVEAALASAGETFEARVGNRRVYAQQLPKLDLWVAASVRQSLWNQLSVWQIALMAMTGASIVAVIGLYRFIRRDFLTPTRELTRVMEGIRAGDRVEVPILDLRFREMRAVNQTLASMVSEIETQKVTIYEEIIERQRAQLQFFQLQLRPHFYLNGLKTINAMAINGDTAQIQSLVHAISDYLRYVLQSRHLVLLREELEFVRNYLSLQDRAYGRQVQVDYDVDAALEDWLVPILSVQTFVENSVKYARTAVAGMPLRLSVRADLLSTEEGRYIDLIISDNCQGYSGEVLDRVNSGNFGDDGQAVGIGNVIRRCRLLYGERAELRFYNDNGAVSELILPQIDEKGIEG